MVPALGSDCGSPASTAPSRERGGAATTADLDSQLSSGAPLARKPRRTHPAEGKCVSGEHAIKVVVCHSAHYPILSHPFFTGILRGAAACGSDDGFSAALTYGTWREAGRDEFDSSKRVIHGSPLF